MAIIKLLDEFTINQIAAGEVVERAASVVKELVENSIDAGATNISIDIIDAGRKLIKVTDNGKGMGYEDSQNAFLRHATSKISDISDIDSIHSLGFRGEALASIASVSKARIITREIGTEMGHQVTKEGSKPQETIQTGCPQGTSIIIEDLFFNTPPRLKFLKSNRTENLHITQVVAGMILSNPHVSIKYINDSRKIFHSSGNSDLLSAIRTIYGNELSKKLIKIDREYKGIKLYGYIGIPELARPNHDRQIMIVNNRYVKVKLMQKAVDDAAATWMGPKNFAFCVLSATLDPANIDVNVHPAKIEIRFKEEAELYKTFVDMITDSMKNYYPHLNSDYINTGIKELKSENIEKDIINADFVKNIKPNIPAQSEPETVNSMHEPGSVQSKKIQKKIDEIMSRGTEKKDIYKPRIIEIDTNEEPEEFVENIKAKYKKQSSTIKHDNIKKPKRIVNVEDIKIENLDIPKEKTVEPEKNKEKQEEQISLLQKSAYEEKELAYKYMGTVFGTYLLFQIDNELVIIDQHAAHERITYERLMQYSDENVISQQLLSPHIISATFDENHILSQNKEILNNMGFNISEFGENDWIVRGVPIEKAGDDIGSLMKNIMIALTKSDTKEAIAMAACKASVKANYKLTELEAVELLKQIKKGAYPLTCPHGRPIMVGLTKYRLERMFLRK